MYDDHFGSLLGHFGTWVTLGPLWVHFGHMMCICAFRVSLKLAKIHNSYWFCNDFTKTHFKRIPHVYQVYVKCLSDVFEMHVRGISDVYEMQCQQLKTSNT